MKTFFTLLFASIASLAQAQFDILYPGDCNNDGHCNYLDLIPIGVAFGTPGPPRPQPGFAWAPVPYNTWETFLPSGIDYAFADADGLDTINAEDIRVIAFNYDSVQGLPPSFPLPEDYLPRLDTILAVPPPMIVISFTQDTVDALDTVYAEIFFFGQTPQPSNPYQGTMVVALRLTYEPINLEESPPRLLFDTLSTGLMSVGATFSEAGFDRSPPQGVAELAVSGYAKNYFKAGPQKIAAIQYIIDMIIRSNSNDTLYKPFTINFDQIILVDSLERRVLPVTAFSQVITLRQITSATAAPDWQAAVRLSPNPARDFAAVEVPAGSGIEKATLWDAFGRPLRAAAGPTQRLELPLAGLPPGVFWVEIVTDRGRVWRKLAVVR